MTLTGFLLAQLQECETEAPFLHRADCSSEVGQTCDCGLPAFVLADIVAKRGLLDRVFIVAMKIDGEWGCCHDADQIRACHGGAEPLTLDCDGVRTAEPFLKLLALPFADRPGYREEWRP